MLKYLFLYLWVSTIKWARPGASTWKISYQNKLPELRFRFCLRRWNDSWFSSPLLSHTLRVLLLLDAQESSIPSQYFVKNFLPILNLSNLLRQNFDTPTRSNVLVVYKQPVNFSLTYSCLPQTLVLLLDPSILPFVRVLHKPLGTHPRWPRFSHRETCSSLSTWRYPRDPRASRTFPYLPVRFFTTKTECLIQSRSNENWFLEIGLLF